jgi:hypothetical protein
MSLADTLKQQEKDFGVGGNSGYFRCEEGNNKVRVLVAWQPVAKHFLAEGEPPVTCIGEDMGCEYHGKKAPVGRDGKPAKPSVKFVTYVLDRADGLVKQAELAYSVIKSIVTLSEDPDWAFDAFPMAYDVTIKYNKQEAPAKMYQVVPSPAKDPIPAEVLADLATRTSVEDVVEQMKANSAI